MEDESVAALPEHIILRIDRAFDKVRRSAGLVNGEDSDQPASKRRRSARLANIPTASVSSPDFEPGGFLLDDQPGGFIVDVEQSAGGGFVVDEQVHTDVSSKAVYTPSASDILPLHLIPSALQILDLPPHDLEILEVFENAASGWSGAKGKGKEQDRSVSRKDWRAVCAVLLEQGQGEQGEDHAIVSPISDGFDLEDDDGYGEEDVMDIDDASPDEEYTPRSTSIRQKSSATSARQNQKLKSTPTPRKRKRKAISRSSSSSDSENDGPKPLTARQKRECREAFALLFPGTLDKDLDNRRLGIKEIAQAAKLIKWKLTAEEIVGMLEVFSSSSDKTMPLSDFERMMVATKLT